MNHRWENARRKQCDDVVATTQAPSLIVTARVSLGSLILSNCRCRFDRWDNILNCFDLHRRHILPLPPKQVTRAALLWQLRCTPVSSRRCLRPAPPRLSSFAGEVSTAERCVTSAPGSEIRREARALNSLFRRVIKGKHWRHPNLLTDLTVV